MVFPYIDIVSKALVVVITSLWLLSLSTKAAAPNYLYNFCGNDTTIYSPNSTFKSNLNLLLSNLSSNNTPNNLFYNATTGPGPPGAAYGLFLCRGDVTINVCHDCVVTASQEIVKNCPNETVAYIWYDECMQRYDNRSFFGTVDESPKVSMLNTENIAEKDRFAKVVGDTLDELVNRASSNRSLNDQYVKRFATGDVNFTSSQRLYSLVQCTLDLSGADCKGKLSSKTIIAIVVPVGLSMVLLAIGFCLLSRKPRRKYHVGEEENGKDKRLHFIMKLYCFMLLPLQ
ncbi:unnamed protein product [Ilex paraguariensis]|uniref:Gnk2-homologous domain-containing protein n=1 Tax=Ilex paraguariensis TaxID=185542 RepID=A0ABC8STS1_9AQUA